MRSNSELELLKFLDNLPKIPSMAPMPFVTKENPFIEIPKVINECAKAVGIKPQFETDGRIHVNNYVRLLDVLQIEHYKPVVFTLKENKSKEPI